MKLLSGNLLSQSIRLQSICRVAHSYGLARSNLVAANIQSVSGLLLTGLLITTGGLGLVNRSALGQTIIRDSESGAVQVDHNAFDIKTGPLENSSYIPLPAHLLGDTHERFAQPVVPGEWSPNNIEIAPDLDYIDRSFNQLLGQDNDNLSYTLQPASLQMTTRFNLGHRSQAHSYGEGIELTVYDADGMLRSREAVFVSGDQVNIGPNGQPLPLTADLNVTYGANETVRLRVLNVRQDGAAPSESGIYFAQDGSFVVEDLQNGGDLDFNDGDYVQLSGGQGTAQTLEERSNISYETQVVEIPLDPELQQEIIEERAIAANLTEFDQVVAEERIWGQIELPETVATQLGHARAARTENNELLVYDRYSGAAQVRLGSDGAGLTAQLSPLIDNPNVPPTLLTGNLTFDPTANDNEAGLTTTLSITQFLNPTHRVARDAFGNEVIALADSGSTLLEPTGLFNNRRMVGYVPPQESEQVLSDRLTSAKGIFEIPTEQSVMVATPDSQKVGRGNAAYTDNVGGLLLEDTAGNLEFVPQWTASGYAQEPLVLEAGMVQRIIYALVPQQAGQALQLGQRYAVTSSADGYRMTDGNFTIISADRQPQNFVQETAEVYAVEDTLPGRNAVTDVFNGIQGSYAQAVGGDLIPTVDVTLFSEADARVGNALLPVSMTTAEPGQRAYAQTTVAAGFYLGGSFTSGIGNQRDTVNRITATMEQATDEIRTQRTINTFATPLTQIDSLMLATTETTVESGTAAFDINAQGELANVAFSKRELLSQDVTTALVDRTSELQRGEAFLIDAQTEETVQFGESRMRLIEQDTSSEEDTYANFAPLQGEIALGGVLNFGNTPWSPAANTARAELFVRDTVIGQGSDSETGWRAEVVLHPFGEQRREAFQYDEAGNLVPVYQTERVQDANGQPLVETLTGENGKMVDLLVNQFVTDDRGDRIAQKVGTGRPVGPGLYLRVEDLFSGDDEGIEFAGGIQFDF